MNATLDTIADDFELLGDWDQRYQYLIELGESLPSMPDLEKTDANRVIPCMSQVWVCAYPDFELDSANHPATIGFHADCDAAIIKGVVALLVKLYEGKTAVQIIAIDVDALFERIQLAENLSPNRHVGIYAIVEVMRKQVVKFLST